MLDKNTLRYTYIDLFCGAGGFSKGFDNVGFKNIFSLDYEPDFCKTYRRNFPLHKLLEKKIQSLYPEEIKKIVKRQKIDVIIGGPPCQGFSMAGNIGRKFLDDERNHLFKEMVRVVNIIQPNFFVVENVQRLFSHNQGRTRSEIINKFEDAGYCVKCEVLNAADFGIPQNRRRVFFIGSKITKKIVFPKLHLFVEETVGKTLSKYPKLAPGESSALPNHIAMNHSSQMLKKMKFLPDGGDRTTIPKSLRPTSGDIRKYIRYDSKKPSITITGDMRKVFHFEQNRALTVRELAALQTFEDDFVFEGTRISQQQQVGNAVPPKLAEEIAKAIKLMLNDKR